MPKLGAFLLGQTVLIADDDPAVSRSVARLLGGYGASVVLATSGEEAVALGRSERFDFIIMDARMPELDGFAAASLILAVRPVRIIFLSAHDVRERARALGCAFVDKFDLMGLVKTMAGMVVESAAPPRP